MNRLAVVSLVAVALLAATPETLPASAAVSDAGSTAIVTVHVADSNGKRLAGAKVFVINSLGPALFCQDKFSDTTDPIGTAAIAFRTDGGYFDIDAFHDGYHVGHSTLIIAADSIQRSFDVHLRLVRLTNPSTAHVSSRRSFVVHIDERSLIGALNDLAGARVYTDLVRHSPAIADAHGNVRLYHNLKPAAIVYMVVENPGDNPTADAYVIGPEKDSVEHVRPVILTPTDYCGTR
jgi:hypothetical protein